MTLHAEVFAGHNQTQTAYFDRHDLPRMVPTGSPYLRRQAAEMARFAGLTREERALDVGCGMGRYTLILAEQGYRVEGLDLTASLLDRFREFDAGRFNVPLHLADVSDPPAELLGAFDVVMATFALHHMHDLRACIEGMKRLAKPGGRVVFLEPNAYNPLYYAQILLSPGMTWAGDKGVAKMRPGLVLPAMREAGLVDARYERFGFFPPALSNRAWGRRVESVLERAPGLGWVRPFQLFGGTRP